MADREPDWRNHLLADVRPEAPPPGRNPLGRAGYEPAAAVRWGRGRVAGTDVVVAWWDFTVLGGSFGEADATAFCAAVDAAAAHGRPLLSLVRSGGTRLQEGMAALVGIPRARLALRRLGEAGVAHVAVCDAPTTGGVWISVGSRADVRAAVRGATVGFAGPRVVEAVTGVPVPPTSHTAEAAAAAGLVDAVLDAEAVPGWLGRVLAAVVPQELPAGGIEDDDQPDRPDRPDEADVDLPARSGWEQVQASRGREVSGAQLLASLLDDPVDLAAPGGDSNVRAALGHLPDAGGVVVVALAAELSASPGPAGYQLLVRAAQLAGRLGLPLLTLVDTPGAAAGPEAEAAGVAAGIAEALDAVLACPSPTVALVHGEGGSGGALAAATCDRVLVTPLATFSALGPEGAAAALRTSAAEAADRAGLRPVDLRRLGFADRVVPAPDRGPNRGPDVPDGGPEAPDGGPEALRTVLAAELVRLAGVDGDERRRRRERRWAGPLPGRLEADG